MQLIIMPCDDRYNSLNSTQHLVYNQNRRCPFCWSFPISEEALAKARRISQTKLSGEKCFDFVAHWDRLRDSDEGKYLLETEFTTILDPYHAKAMEGFLAMAEADFIVRFHDSTFKTPDEFEMKLAFKMFFFCLKERIDEMELRQPSAREERAELIVEMGIARAALNLKHGESTEYPCCFNEYCSPTEDPPRYQPVVPDDNLREESLEGHALKEQPCLTPCNHLIGSRCLREWLMKNVVLRND
ncbi:hypothetical protein HYALB_00002484 [Hymenoscyphus albidus]|uniref:Uncharacterized protein n=1 Tax=Hymenoscyphus albidus TaxID=595503 RepID=A0A9N9LRP2_9HELO|nr:hypothetical protein HYALB_00002484 [Hymenoscyphus albidus]